LKKKDFFFAYFFVSVFCYDFFVNPFVPVNKLLYQNTVNQFFRVKFLQSPTLLANRVLGVYGKYLIDLLDNNFALHTGSDVTDHHGYRFHNFA